MRDFIKLFLFQDADGKITLTEFVNACLGHEQFSKMLALKVLKSAGGAQKTL